MDYINNAEKEINENTDLRIATSGSKTIASGVTKYLNIDSLTYGAEIISIIIKGVVSAAWTVDVYIPVIDGINSPAAGDLRDTIIYESTDLTGGLISAFSLPYNTFLNFTNNSLSSDDIDEVKILYRSNVDLTISWEV